jgi:hypothetical protein
MPIEHPGAPKEGWADTVPDVGPLDRLDVCLDPGRQRVVLRYSRGGSPLCQIVPVHMAALKRIMAQVLLAESGISPQDPRKQT